MAECENNECSDEATMKFYDGTKPIDLNLCHHHCHLLCLAYEREGQTYQIQEIER